MDRWCQINDCGKRKPQPRLSKLICHTLNTYIADWSFPKHPLLRISQAVRQSHSLVAVRGCLDNRLAESTRQTFGNPTANIFPLCNPRNARKILYDNFHSLVNFGMICSSLSVDKQATLLPAETKGLQVVLVLFILALSRNSC